jgi:hypothetical protein
MSKKITNKVILTNLLDHSAVKFWRELGPDRPEPGAIVVLKEQRKGYHKSAIYRLEGVGPAGTSIIAKRCRRTTALVERTIYEEILPNLPITAPHYYGFAEEDDEFCWLFLEDVGTGRFSPLIEEHRALATRWLGLMHTTAAHLVPTPHLPDRGPNHYLEHLRSGRRTILHNLANPAFKAEDIAILESVVSQCDFLESCWDQVQKFCERMPSTLAHGDFRPKNVYIRTGQAGTGLFPIDWETAGWGVPAADLAPARRRHSAHLVDITAYWSIVRECWPSLDLSAVQQLANVGIVFRRLAAINWASLSLAYEWPSKPISYMRSYQVNLSDAIQEAPWAQ